MGTSNNLLLIPNNLNFVKTILKLYGYTYEYPRLEATVTLYKLGWLAKQLGPSLGGLRRLQSGQ